MTKKRGPGVRRGARGTERVDWRGGMATLPAYTFDDGKPYRPELLLWVGADGKILGSTLARPGETLGMASESLRSAMEQPLCGAPHVPERVFVSSDALADALRAGHPGLEVVCRPLPEMDGVFERLGEALLSSDDEDASYYLPHIEPDACASFFRAAAALFRCEPWNKVPGDPCVLSVDIETLGIRGAVAAVIGQLGESRGVLLFSSASDFEDFLGAAAALDRGEEPRLPVHLGLNFEPRDTVPEAILREVGEHGWEVAGEAAYPWLTAMDEDLVARAPTASELWTAEAIAFALPAVLADAEAFHAAGTGGPPVTRTVSVRTHAGEIAVTLGVSVP